MSPSRALILSVAEAVHQVPVPYCPTCQIMLQAQSGDRFCEDCGDKIATKMIRVVHCSCDPARELHGRYCPECGTATEILVNRAEAEARSEQGLPA